MNLACPLEDKCLYPEISFQLSQTDDTEIYQVSSDDYSIERLKIIPKGSFIKIYSSNNDEIFAVIGRSKNDDVMVKIIATPTAISVNENYRTTDYFYKPENYNNEYPTITDIKKHFYENEYCQLSPMFTLDKSTGDVIKNSDFLRESFVSDDNRHQIQNLPYMIGVDDFDFQDVNTHHIFYINQQSISENVSFIFTSQTEDLSTTIHFDIDIEFYEGNRKITIENYSTNADEYSLIFTEYEVESVMYYRISLQNFSEVRHRLVNCNIHTKSIHLLKYFNYQPSNDRNAIAFGDDNGTPITAIALRNNLIRIDSNGVVVNAESTNISNNITAREISPNENFDLFEINQPGYYFYHYNSSSQITIRNIPSTVGGSFSFFVYPNGNSQPFSVTLVDNSGRMFVGTRDVNSRSISWNDLSEVSNQITAREIPDNADLFWYTASGYYFKNENTKDLLNIPEEIKKSYISPDTENSHVVLWQDVLRDPVDSVLSQGSDDSSFTGRGFTLIVLPVDSRLDKSESATRYIMIDVTGSMYTGIRDVNVIVDENNQRIISGSIIWSKGSATPTPSPSPDPEPEPEPEPSPDIQEIEERLDKLETTIQSDSISFKNTSDIWVFPEDIQSIDTSIYEYVTNSKPFPIYPSPLSYQIGNGIEGFITLSTANHNKINEISMYNLVRLYNVDNYGDFINDTPVLNIVIPDDVRENYFKTRIIFKNDMLMDEYRIPVRFISSMDYVNPSDPDDHGGILMRRYEYEYIEGGVTKQDLYYYKFRKPLDVEYDINLAFNNINLEYDAGNGIYTPSEYLHKTSNPLNEYGFTDLGCRMMLCFQKNNQETVTDIFREDEVQLYSDIHGCHTTILTQFLSMEIEVIGNTIYINRNVYDINLPEIHEYPIPEPEPV